MTKSIIITYNEADEGFLMTLFKRFKIKTQAAEPLKVEDRQPKEEILAGLMESAREVEAALQGKTKLRSAYDVLAELEAEQAATA